MVQLLRTSRWVKSVNKLRNEDWVELRERALEYAPKRKRMLEVALPDVTASVDASSSSGYSELDDFELKSDEEL